MDVQQAIKILEATMAAQTEEQARACWSEFIGERLNFPNHELKFVRLMINRALIELMPSESTAKKGVVFFAYYTQFGRTGRVGEDFDSTDAAMVACEMHAGYPLLWQSSPDGKGGKTAQNNKALDVYAYYYVTSAFDLETREYESQKPLEF